MIEKSQKKKESIHTKVLRPKKNVSSLLHGKLNKIGRSDLFSKKYIWDERGKYGQKGGIYI